MARTKHTVASASKKVAASGKKSFKTPSHAHIGDKKVRVLQPRLLNIVYEWMAERHQMYERRLAGEPKPWSEDPIMQKHSFANVYRLLDRGTQYLVQHVLNDGSQDHIEVVFRTILFRLFNRVETWELLRARLGPVLSWATFDLDAYEAVLAEAVEEGATLYTSAYILPAPKFGWPKNYQNHLRLVQVMMESGLPAQLKRVGRIRDAFEIVTLYPSMGNFLGYQLTLDLNLGPHLSWPEDEWAPACPGSGACLRKIFGAEIRGHESDAMEWLYTQQDAHWERIGYKPSVCPARPGVSIVDIEHSLCEVEKYSRVAMPSVKGRRTSIKAMYKMDDDGSGKPRKVTAIMPRKWDKAPAIVYPREVEQESDAPWEDGDEFEVSHVVAEAANGRGGVKFLIRWVGYGPKDDTWQPEDDLGSAVLAVKEWQKRKADIAGSIAELGGKGVKGVRKAVR